MASELSQTYPNPPTKPPQASQPQPQPPLPPTHPTPTPSPSPSPTLAPKRNRIPQCRLAHLLPPSNYPCHPHPPPNPYPNPNPNPNPHPHPPPNPNPNLHPHPHPPPNPNPNLHPHPPPNPNPNPNPKSRPIPNPTPNSNKVPKRIHNPPRKPRPILPPPPSHLYTHHIPNILNHQGFKNLDPQASDYDSDHDSDHDSSDDVAWRAHHHRSTRVLPSAIPASRPEPDSGNKGGLRLDEGMRNWLVGLGLARYAPVFEIHEVDEEVLPLLTLDDLKDMGITAVGTRRKLYFAIQKLPKSALS